MDTCLFCKIAQGKIPSEKIYETDKVFCSLDINPLAKGHTLVIPKKHYQNIFDIDEAALKELIGVAKKVAHMQKNNLNAAGVSLFQSSGEAAQQEVLHFHIHLLPRFKGDSLDTWPRSNYQKENLKELGRKLRGNSS